MNWKKNRSQRYLIKGFWSEVYDFSTNVIFKNSARSIRQKKFESFPLMSLRKLWEMVCPGPKYFYLWILWFDTLNCPCVTRFKDIITSRAMGQAAIRHLPLFIILKIDVLAKAPECTELSSCVFYYYIVFLWILSFHL